MPLRCTARTARRSTPWSACRRRSAGDLHALKGANVGVTLVCPGAVATEIMSQVQNTGPGNIPGWFGQLAPEVQAAWDSMGAYTDAGIPSDDVGDMVVAAIQDNRFWLLPRVFHPIFERELADLEAER